MNDPGLDLRFAAIIAAHTGQRAPASQNSRGMIEAEGHQYLASSSERLKQSALADPGLLLTRSGAAQLSASAAIKGLKPATELFGKLHIGAARLATIQAMFDN